MSEQASEDVTPQEQPTKRHGDELEDAVKGESEDGTDGE